MWSLELESLGFHPGSVLLTCVILGSSLSLPVPEFPHVKRRTIRPATKGSCENEMSQYIEKPWECLGHSRHY